MEVYYINNLNDLPELDKNSCAIGNFDGLHQGHRELIRQAKIDNLKTLVVSFENINKNNYLTITKQKIRLIEELDVDSSI